MKGSLLFLMLFIAAATSMKMKQRRWPPRFCKSKPCPKFEDLSKTLPRYLRREKIHLRCYEPVTLVESKVLKESPEGEDFKNATQRLVAYLSGKNEDGVNVPVGVPYSVKNLYNVKDESYTCTVEMFIPKGVVPPTPTDEMVVIKKEPAFCMYVKVFHGNVYKNPALVGNNIEALIDALSKEEGKFPIVGDGAESWSAQYSLPGSKGRRHNEVWVLKDDRAEGAEEGAEE